MPLHPMGGTRIVPGGGQPACPHAAATLGGKIAVRVGVLIRRLRHQIAEVFVTLAAHAADGIRFAGDDALVGVRAQEEVVVADLAAPENAEETAAVEVCRDGS